MSLFNTPKDYGKFENFPVGKRVRVNVKLQDFHFFHGDETGYVIRNSGKYLGIIVKFDYPWRCQHSPSHEHVMETFNFNPVDLLPLYADLVRVDGQK